MPGRKALVSALVCVVTLALVGSALALDIADASPPSGTTGVPYSYTFRLSEGSGSPGSGWSISSGQLPPGLALSSNDRTATVYGTPTRAGEFRFYLQVRDAPGPWHCCTEEEFTIAIRDGLGISTPDLPVGNVGSSYGYQLATSGGAATAWTVAAGTLPPGVALTPDGAITGTPTQAAVTQFTVRAVSGDRTASKQFTLKVTEPLLATAPAATAIKLGRQFLLPFAVKGGLGPYTWSGIDLPAGIGVNPKTGQVGGRPNAAGELMITAKVTDSLGVSTTARSVVRVAGALSLLTTKLPVARNGRRFAATLVASGGATPFQLRLAGNKPGWLRFDGATGALTGSAKLDARKPLVLVKRTKKGVKRIVKPRQPTPVAYNLYVTATDALGQRSTKRLTLTVRP